MATRGMFRFGAFVDRSFHSRSEWVDYARKVESLGYSTLVVGEHIVFGGLAPVPALMAAADATTHLRLATHVVANDFRHPVLLAQEVATLDLLSDGRLEFGIGSGFLGHDYTATGVPLDTPGVRVARLEEAVSVIKRLFGDEPVTFEGEYYTIREMTLQTKPVQRPHPPLFIGGGGKRVLSLAGREADIVGLNPKGTKDGRLDVADDSWDATARKVEWVREAAGARFDDLELHVLVSAVVTDDRRGGIDEVAAGLASVPPSFFANVDTSDDAILQSSTVLIGSVDTIVETLQERRERFGISYITLFGESMEAFTPVVERLAGT